MTSIGDLFVSVRAKTSGLTKGLRKANRSIQAFSKSAAGTLAMVGAGFLGFKGLQTIASGFFSSLMYHSEDFRTAWIEMTNSLRDAFRDLAIKWGPQLANTIKSLTQKLITLLTQIDAATDPEAWNQLGKDAKRGAGWLTKTMLFNPSTLGPGGNADLAEAKARLASRGKAGSDSFWYSEVGQMLLYMFGPSRKTAGFTRSGEEIPVKIMSGGPE